MLAPSLKQFSLRVEILPSYIPVRVAEKILFVGESVQMFENQNVNLTRKGRNVLARGTPHPQRHVWHHVDPKSARAEWVARDLHVLGTWDMSGWLGTFMLFPAAPGREPPTCGGFLTPADRECFPVLQDPFWRTRRTLLQQSCIVSSSSPSSAWWTLSRWWIVFAVLWPRLVFLNIDIVYFTYLIDCTRSSLWCMNSLLLHSGFL